MMKLNEILSVLFLLIVSLSCNSIHDNLYSETSDSSFRKFYECFQIDSVFQKERTLVPILCTEIDEFGGCIHKSINNWTFISFSSFPFFGIETFNELGPCCIIVSYTIPDTDVQVKMVFRKINKLWYFTDYFG